MRETLRLNFIRRYWSTYLKDNNNSTQAFELMLKNALPTIFIQVQAKKVRHQKYGKKNLFAKQ